MTILAVPELELNTHDRIRFEGHQAVHEMRGWTRTRCGLYIALRPANIERVAEPVSCPNCRAAR